MTITKSYCPNGSGPPIYLWSVRTATGRRTFGLALSRFEAFRIMMELAFRFNPASQEKTHGTSIYGPNAKW